MHAKCPLYQGHCYWVVWRGAFLIGGVGGEQETYKSAESRMQQEALRRHVLRVLRIWRDWFIFADDFLNGLQVC